MARLTYDLFENTNEISSLRMHETKSALNILQPKYAEYDVDFVKLQRKFSWSCSGSLKNCFEITDIISLRILVFVNTFITSYYYFQT